MTVEQWGIRVPIRQGEVVRQELIREGVFDTSLRVLHDGDALVLPILDGRESARRFTFQPVPGRPVLPRHELVGGIAILHEHDPVGADQVLHSRPSLHTVLCSEGEVSGEYRTRGFSVLAGMPTTRTRVTEHGHHFTVDLAAAYFSARLATERQRILAQTRGNEMVLDMFAGVGPFAITLAGRAASVVASDINPQAVLLMLENLAQNRITNVLPVLADAWRLDTLLPWRFDRVIMNLPLSGTEFLPAAFRLCRPGGTIHFYALVSQEGGHGARIREMGGVIVAERVVRSYSASQWHAVYDIMIDIP
jgi:tRNA (guanine37-N1)-methyltransferase